MTADLTVNPEALAQASRRVLEKLPASLAHWRQARELIPGGTGRNRFYWPIPIYIDRGEGPLLIDVDGHRYIDLILGHGPNILGYGHPAVTGALHGQIDRGSHFGPPMVAEARLAGLVSEHVPGAERVQFVTSGTEATLAAMRFARAFTGRQRIAKCEGGWHGWHDFSLYSVYDFAGPPANPRPVATSAGLPADVQSSAVVLPFNDPAAIPLLESVADEVACVIVEGVLGAGGAIPAEPGWIRDLRAACERLGVLFVLDEVITGFSLGPGGAAAALGITPDIVTLGKIVGGGVPIGAVCGRRDVLDLALAREGKGPPVLLFGTWTGNPLAMTAGAATVEALVADDGAAYTHLDHLGDALRTGLAAVFAARGVPATVTGAGRMFGVHIGSDVAPRSGRDAHRQHAVLTEVLSAYLLSEGVFFNGGMHLGFVSTAHTDAHIERTVAALGRCLDRVVDDGILVVGAGSS